MMWFIKLYNLFFNFYYYIWSLLFTVVKIYGVKDGERKNLYWQYIMAKILGIKSDTYDVIKMETYNGITRNIIWDSATVNDVVDGMSNIKYDVNELIMHKNCIVLDIFLNGLSIKDLVEHYADRSKVFNHNIRN